MLNEIAVFGNEHVSACNLACEAKNKLIKGFFTYKEFEDVVIKMNKNYYLTEAIFDTSCADGNPLEFAINLKKLSRPDVRIIIITPEIDDNTYDKYLRNGFYDIVFTRENELEFIEAIKNAIVNPVKFSEVADRIIAYKPKVEIIEIVKRRIKFVSPSKPVKIVLTALVIATILFFGSKVIKIDDVNPVPTELERELINIVFKIDDVEIGDVMAHSGDYIVPPEIKIEGYKFTGWDFDFSKPVEDNLVATAIYECIDTEHYPEKIENLQIIEEDMNGLDEEIEDGK